MKQGLLENEYDPMGAAIRDYYETGRAGRLRVFSSQFDEDEMPVATLFRKEDEMPYIERKALELCSGSVLDVGGGAGCHSLALQDRGLDVTAVDISKLSVEVMERRGVKKALAVDLFDESFVGCYDTVLMLMNGSGVVGRLERMPLFFRRMKQLLSPRGCVLMDSSDLRYVFEDEDGCMDIDLNAAYYGEVDFRMQYKQIKGRSFDWLYVDFDTLSYYAAENGFKAERIADGSHYDYLARLTMNQ
jgi:SAM-dependent methyltransferase